MGSKPHKLTIDEAVQAAPSEPDAEVRAWQIKKIQDGLKAADEGRFASAEAVKRVILKYIPKG